MVGVDFSKELKNISCTTLIICGEKDKVNKKVSKSLAANISVAELQMIENVGHEVNSEAPKKLARALETFYLKHHL